MKRQRHNLQTNKQKNGCCPLEEINKKEANKLSDIEFKRMVTRMLKELIDNYKELSENYKV